MDEQKTERFNLFMSPSELKAIDEWAWKNKVRSLSEAVRRLCKMGMRVDELERAREANLRQIVELGKVLEKHGLMEEAGAAIRRATLQ